MIAQLNFVGPGETQSARGKPNLSGDVYPGINARLYIRPVGADESVRIPATHSLFGTFVFANITAGRYELAELTVGSASQFIAGGSSGVATGDQVYVRWYGQALRISATEAEAGIVGFLGTHHIELNNTNSARIAGEKTPAAMERAFENMHAYWKGEWPEQLRLQLSEAY